MNAAEIRAEERMERATRPPVGSSRVVVRLLWHVSYGFGNGYIGAKRTIAAHNPNDAEDVLRRYLREYEPAGALSWIHVEPFETYDTVFLST